MKALFSVDSRSRIFSVQEQFEVAKSAGFDGIDYIASLRDVFIYPQKVNQYSKKLNIPILGVHSPLPLVVMTPSLLFKNIFALVKNFPHCEIYNFHLSGLLYPPFDGLNHIRTLMELARKNNMPIAFESNPKVFPMQFYSKATYVPEYFGDYCKTYNLPIAFDTSHIAHQGYNIIEFFKKYHAYIQLIHLSDYKDSIQHLPLGNGNLPLRELLQEMKKVSFQKPVVFEIYTFPKNQTRMDTFTDIKNSLTFFRKHG